MNKITKILMLVLGVTLVFGLLEDAPVNLDLILGWHYWVSLETFFHGLSLASFLLLWRLTK